MGMSLCQPLRKAFIKKVVPELSLNVWAGRVGLLGRNEGTERYKKKELNSHWIGINRGEPIK